MTWVKLDDQFFANPKVIDLSKDAKLLYLCGLAHCAAQLTDGRITSGALRSVAALVDVDRGLAAELVGAGLWERAEGGYQVHDYNVYNPSAAQVKAERDQNARRQHEWREQQRAKRNAVSNGVTNVATNKEVTPLVTGAPYPFPYPINITPQPPSTANGSANGVGEHEAREAVRPQPKTKPALTTAAAKAAFQTFWERYPKRNGIKGDRKQAELAYAAIPPEEWPEIQRAVERYAAICDPNRPDPRRPRDAERFLKDGFWRNVAEADEAPLSNGRAPLKSVEESDRELDEILRPARAGPAPPDPG